jgi:hypothetical protein
MKKILTPLAILLAAQWMTGCEPELERADQDNFVVDASGIGGPTLARELSLSMETKLRTRELALHNADKTELYRLDGRGFMIVLMPLSDGRCIPEPNRHFTYKNQQFGLDLVYSDSFQNDRQALKQRLLSALDRLQVPVQKFAECDHSDGDNLLDAPNSLESRWQPTNRRQTPLACRESCPTARLLSHRLADERLPRRSTETRPRHCEHS